MKVDRPLLRQFTALLALVVATLSLGAFVITSRVTRSGLEDLFRQRLEHAKVVLSEYVRGRHLARVAELDGVLTSPRFLAAMETLDPATISEAVTSHLPLRDAALLLIVDEDERIIYVSEGTAAALQARVRELTRTLSSPIDVVYLAEDGDVYEFVVAELVANNGAPLGRVVSGESLTSAYADDLRKLTGFEILIVVDGHVATASLGGEIGPESDFSAFVHATPEAVTRVEVAGRDMLAYCVPDTISGTAVSFVAPIDDAIDPIMDRIRALLMALALGGGVVGLAIVHAYTKRRVVSQVRRLAGHAEEIARGNLDTVIEAQTPDELGYLASEFEKMRVQLAENRREIEAAHRERVDAERLAALGRFATGIIHDFKNPMAVVRGTADLIQSRFPENEKLSRQCTVIHRQVDRMVALTRDVLEYASGRSVLDVCEVDVESFLSEIREGHLESFRRAGVKLLLRGEPITVTIDPVRLRRVIDNVITNALEVSKVGDSVTAEWGLAADGSVYVAIEDEGPGIPPGLADAIFDPFVTSGKEGGSGLGLAIARKIVQDHGASLRVGPGKNGGARFSIDLPSKLHVESKPVAAPEVR